MFYESNPEQYLRFGDIITGIPHCICKTEIKNRDNSELYLSHNPAVVLTPCCSIARDGLITLAPLEHIKTSWMKNDHFQDDLCKINTPMLPAHMISTERYNQLKPVDRVNFSGTEHKYTLVDYFIYAPHPLLSRYQEKKVSDIGYYCICFSKICTLQFFDFIYSKGNTPPLERGIKLLELSDGTRDCLRRKIHAFFDRNAD